MQGQEGKERKEVMGRAWQELGGPLTASSVTVPLYPSFVSSVVISGSWEDGIALYPTPRTNYSQNTIGLEPTGDQPPTVTTVSVPLPDGTTGNADRVQFPTITGPFPHSISRSFMYDAPRPAGESQFVYARSTSPGPSQQFRLADAGSTTATTYATGDNWQRFERVTSSGLSFYNGVGTDLGDPVADITVSFPSYGSPGRYIPTVASAATEIDYIYDGAVGIITLTRPLSTGGTLVADGKACTQISANKWQVQAT